MRTNELKTIISTIEGLGYEDIPIVISESRDGDISYVDAKAYVNTDDSGKIVLVINYE